jgi:lia operon protein LiaG
MFGKTRLTRVVVVTALIAVAAFAVAGLLGLATTGFQPRQLGHVDGMAVDERTSLPASGVGEVSIHSVNEDVRVVEGTGETFEAWLHGTAGTGRPQSVPHLRAERDGATVAISIDRPALTIGFFWSNLTLEVTVPKGYAGRLSAGTVSARIDVSAHPYAGVALSTTSGDVNAGAVKTVDFAMHSRSGRLLAAGVVSQTADLSTVSGQVKLSSFAGDAKVHSTSGDVDVHYAIAPGSFNAVSTSGTVTVGLPADAQFSLDA